ncbi:MULTISPECIES: DUF1761 family protein [Sphingosinicellaceae]|uniref:DUF1761 family protein n=1 Tax=Sphingosinicellaceae TaxID=2820280 RepID=UPI001C1E5463|nr:MULTISPECIES: DUF1761 family protein [Polymorphobacter]QYE33540.1 DUF1761 domain-containing protein [Polymorphobacter sp. PAMC 29334]UAJ12234.1 DUF1761 domain-containing protein [Polymorphobacter megasporae]
MHILWVMGVSLVVASLADWLFIGVLFHNSYSTFPEVWRDAKDKRRQILIAQAYSAMTAVGFICLAIRLTLVSLGGALSLAVLIWIIAPLPLLLGNHVFIKLDQKVTLAHALGWLVKLLLIGATTAALL